MQWLVSAIIQNIPFLSDEQYRTITFSCGGPVRHDDRKREMQIVFHFGGDNHWRHVIEAASAKLYSGLAAAGLETQDVYEFRVCQSQDATTCVPPDKK